MKQNLFQIACLKRGVVTLFLLIISFISFAQCPQLYDGNGNPSNAPYWISCFGGDYTLNIQSPDDIGAYTIDWGDGSGVTSGGSLLSGNTVSHTYSSTVDTFVVTFNEVDSGCAITGVVVMETAVTASIQRPAGGVTQACAPATLRFINSSTNSSPTTTYIWDFGDGSPVEVYGGDNAGDTLAHTYAQGTVDCNTEVELTAENYCSGGQSYATNGPIRIWDLDEAEITASNTLLCYPDTEVTFQNTSELNCNSAFEGNTFQRQEYWNFGDYWGLGYDSIIDWAPFPPSPNITIAYPGKGTYQVMMIDSSYCGLDTAYSTIVITDPPTAALSASPDTICVDESITFSNLSGGGADVFDWNFGDGSGWSTTGGGSQTHTYTISGDFTVQLVAHIAAGSGSCLDTATVDIHVLPSPQAGITLDNSVGCDSLTVNFTDASFSAVSWNWDFDNGNTSTAQDPGAQFYSSTGTYTVTQTVTSNNGCTDTDQETINVYQSPVVDFVPKNVCEDEVASFNDASTSSPGDPIISWDWDFGDGNTSTAQNPTNTYTDSGTYQIILAVATANCSAEDTFSVTAEPVPTAGFSASDTAGCAPLAVGFTNTSAIATNFSWDFGDGNTSAQTNPSHTYTNTSGSDVTYTVELIASTGFGCSDTTSRDVFVYANPAAAFSSDATPDCGPHEVNFTNSSTGAVSYNWDFGDSTGSTTTNPSHVYNNQTLFIENYTAQLVATSANGCTDTAEETVTIYPEPIFGFSSIPDSGCSPLEVTFPSVVGAVVYNWDFGDGNTATGPTPTHTFVNSTTNNVEYTVQLIATNSFGCNDTVYDTVKVQPNPTAQFNTDITAGCQPLEVTFQNNSTGAVDYSWDFDDGDTSDTAAASFPHTFTNVTAASVFNTVSLVAETQDGCTDTAYQQIEVYPHIIAAFSSDTAGCTPLNVSFSDQSTNAAAFSWDFGDGSSSTEASPDHVYTNSTTTSQIYTAELIATSNEGCKDTVDTAITVYPKPIAQFSPNVSAGCHPLTVAFTNSSVIATEYSWDLGDGTNTDTSGNFGHTYFSTSSVPVTREVELTVESQFGCKDTFQQSIEIYPPIEAGFSVDTVGCSPLSLKFTDLSTGEQSYLWEFGDGFSDNSTNPAHTFTNSGLTDTVFTSELVVTSAYNCRDTAQQEILIHPKPVADFNTDVINGCHPLEVNIENSSQIVVDYSWDFDDGFVTDTADTAFGHTYTNTSSNSMNHDIVLIVESSEGCKDTMSRSIEVYPLIMTKFTTPDSGCSPFQVNFSDQSTGVDSYSWDFGDGGTDVVSNPVHTYMNNSINDTIFTAMLVGESTYGCRDTAIDSIVVHPSPVADFTATPVTQVYPEATVSMANSTNLGNWTYEWEFGDQNGSSEQSPSPHTYATWGEYIIQLLVYSDYCRDSAEQQITIIPPVPVADFIGNKKDCGPVTIDFVNESKYATNYTWDFGDGGSSNLENPTYTYYNPGTYTVTLSVEGPGGEHDTMQVDTVAVYENADAYFDVSPAEVVVPNEAATFLNFSTDADSYLWDFGDSTTSEEEHPEHYYEDEGGYTVTLIANNEFNCPDTFIVEDAVIARLSGEVQFPNAFTPDPTGSNGGTYSSQDPFNNDVFFPITEGVTDFHLMIFNRWGELVFESFDYKIGWDGYYHGELCQQDVYVWKVEAEFINGRKVVKTGDVTLIR